MVVKDDNNPEWIWGVDISEVDGRYLMLYINKDTDRVRFHHFVCIFILCLLTLTFHYFRHQKNKLWVTDLKKNEIGPNMKWDKLVDTFDAAQEVLVQPHFLSARKFSCFTHVLFDTR